MKPQDYLTPDGQAVLLLCSAFALPTDARAAGLEPLALSEWNDLERRICDSALKRPAALHGRSAAELSRFLALPPSEAERIARLLDRAGRLTLELEELFRNGLWAVTRWDELYPPRLRQLLRHQAPSVLFGSGNIRLLQRAGLAVVGSRAIDQAGTAFAQQVGRLAAAAGLPVVSGGARGTDRLAMQAALEADGAAVGVLADSLEQTVRQAEVLQFLIDGRLALLTPYLPRTGFSVGAAMGRNKLIYALAEFAVVVSSDWQAGGTWAGAIEALKAGWCPVFVRQSPNAPRGNADLIKRGAVPFPESQLASAGPLPDWLRAHVPSRLVEPDLFQPEN